MSVEIVQPCDPFHVLLRVLAFLNWTKEAPSTRNFITVHWIIVTEEILRILKSVNRTRRNSAFIFARKNLNLHTINTFSYKMCWKVIIKHLPWFIVLLTLSGNTGSRRTVDTSGNVIFFILFVEELSVREGRWQHRISILRRRRIKSVELRLLVSGCWESMLSRRRIKCSI